MSTKARKRCNAAMRDPAPPDTSANDELESLRRKLFESETPKPRAERIVIVSKETSHSVRRTAAIAAALILGGTI